MDITSKGNKDIKKDVLELDYKNVIVELLEKNDAIKTIKKDGKNVALSHLNSLDEEKIRNTILNLKEIAKDNINLKNVKISKVCAVLGNIALVSFMMGFVQPKLTILMRKVLNHGDKRNPAIVEQENKARKMNDIKI